MVTKKQRRTQLARARAQRRAESRARREARRRRIRAVALVVAVLAALVALTAWIVTRDDDGTSAASAPGDYDAWTAVPHTTPIEVSR